MPTANELLARTMKARGIDTIYHITGAPNIQLTRECEKLGIALVGVRHEAAAAGMAFGHARVTGKPAVCLAPAGPGAVNMIPGAVHAMAEQTPVLLIGGSSPLAARGTGGFQELDQIALFEPCVKKALQVCDPADIGRLFDKAMAIAATPTQGAVYLDLPGDVLGMEVPSLEIPAAAADTTPPAPSGDQADAVLDALDRAQRPVIVSGSGVIWSGAGAALAEFVDLSGVPFFTTPQGRGVVSEDHPLALLGARTMAFREADFVLATGTRGNFIIGYLKPPRWSDDLTVAMINPDHEEILKTGPAIALPYDARLSLEALNDRLRARPPGQARFAPWIARLREKHLASCARLAEMEAEDARPIHPMRLMCEIGKVLEHDAVLIEDGHDTLGFCRHSLKTHVPGHRINPGTMGNVGMGVPFAIGAKAARPAKQVVVVSGDSAFGWNGIEFDTACRHDLPIVCVIVNNAGITARPEDPAAMMPGQDLGTPDYQMVAQAFGGYGERVDKAEDIEPALRRAIASGKPAVVNVIVDPHIASATNLGFAGVMSQSYASDTGSGKPSPA
ncbi:MAG: thiamine pyrophosphate-binding protein [Novosphingobium sp.]|nr:thiamine pyrophosphate-binding protein [Novosphingobium sp.]MCP5401568.1 thiamine pyrophosphate-binding protein [Novosphingobium sp.]